MRLAVTIALGLTLFMAATVHAGPFSLPKKSEARRALKLGNKHLRVRNFERAIVAYKQGFLVETTPVFLHNLGLAYRLNKNYKVAISYYRSFLREANPQGAPQAAIEKLITDMQGELDQAASRKPPIEPEPRKPKTRVIDKPKTAPVQRASTAWYGDGVGWGVSGGGLVVLGVGVGLLVNASGLRGDADRELSFAKKDELNGKADTRQAWAFVFGVAGVAALGVGIVKLVLHDLSDRSTSSTISVAIGFDSIRLQGRF